MTGIDKRVVAELCSAAAITAATVAASLFLPTPSPAQYARRRGTRRANIRASLLQRRGPADLLELVSFGRTGEGVEYPRELFFREHRMP